MWEEKSPEHSFSAGQVSCSRPPSIWWANSREKANNWEWDCVCPCVREKARLATQGDIRAKISPRINQGHQHDKRFSNRYKHLSNMFVHPSVGEYLPGYSGIPGLLLWHTWLWLLEKCPAWHANTCYSVWLMVWLQSELANERRNAIVIRDHGQLPNSVWTDYLKSQHPGQIHTRLWMHLVVTHTHVGYSNTHCCQVTGILMSLEMLSLTVWLRNDCTFMGELRSSEDLPKLPEMI